MTIQLGMFALETPTMNKLDVSRCVVKPVNYKTASRFCNEYHYAGRTPSIVVSLGMYVDDIMAGVITYGIPPVPNVQRACGEEYRKNALELNRLFIFDWCGRNSESWLIGQSFRYLEENKPNYFILVSYSDTTQNHMGTIYQATNWLYTGFQKGRRVGYLVQGKERHNKYFNNTIGSNSPTKVIKHYPGAEILYQKGKHRYVYFLGNRRQRRKMRKLLKWPVLPYPKREPQKSTTTLTS